MLEPVYEALELDWDPATVGAVRAARGTTVREAVLAEYAERYELVEDTLDDDTLALARTLAPEHRPPAERRHSTVAPTVVEVSGAITGGTNLYSHSAAPARR